MSLGSDFSLLGKLEVAISDVENAIDSPEGQAIMTDVKDAFAKLESYFASKAPVVPPVEPTTEPSATE